MVNPRAYIGARRLVEVCGALKKNELVAIVTDTEKILLANLIAGQVATMEAEPTILVMSPRVIDGEEPTKLVHETISHADLVILAATRSLAHTTATRESLTSGARVLSVTNISEALLISGGLYADFYAIRPVCEALANIFSRGRELNISAPGGTEITISISDREGNAHHCIADKPGMFTAVPNIESNVAPVEWVSRGEIVFDASIPNFGIGVLEQPVRMTIRDGCVVEISGGRQAKYLDRIFGDQKDLDEAVCNLAQVAVGLNPKCRHISGQLTNDHGVLGTMHFGIGTSKNLGGSVQTSMHFDGILWSPTILVDGEVVIRSGKPIGDWGTPLIEMEKKLNFLL